MIRMVSMGIVFGYTFFSTLGVIYGETIVNSKHNLSISGPGDVKAVLEDRICIFCHTVKRSNTSATYLWNRSMPAQVYIPYESSTLYANVGQPTGASKLCLSCHDGTIALGALGSEPTEILFAGGLRFMPPDSTRLGTDLSDDHPISFVYNTHLAQANGELKDPSQLTGAVHLDATNQLQCTACHDPHDNAYGMFLVMSNAYSALCLKCHDKRDWSLSAHAYSTAQWNGLGRDPWPNSTAGTVAENACKNCHSSHTAPHHERLLNQFYEEDNCLGCHNGNVAQANIEAGLAKSYGHFVQDYSGVHDAAEDFKMAGPAKHVECADCHNPHRANEDSSSGGALVSGANKGVSGINAGNQRIGEALYLYEICFKCHADNNVLSSLPITRQLSQLNTRLEFDPSNPSYHPVEAAGQNPDVPSLLSPYTVNSIITCVDCHNSDTPQSGSGPHGSVYEFLLERNYETRDMATESSNAYALCYKCHSRTSILNDDSFSEHRMHIVDKRTPCAVCHDPHGISAAQGTAVNNSHLINFDLSVVSPESGQSHPIFEDSGRFAGSCTLVCHGESHRPESYP